MVDLVKGEVVLSFGRHELSALITHNSFGGSKFCRDFFPNESLNCGAVVTLGCLSHWPASTIVYSCNDELFLCTARHGSNDNDGPLFVGLSIWPRNDRFGQ